MKRARQLLRDKSPAAALTELDRLGAVIEASSVDDRCFDARGSRKLFARNSTVPAADWRDMTATSASTLAFAALLANLAFVATGCGSSGGTSSDPAADPVVPARADGTEDTPKAPAVGGPATTNELTDELGVFVALSGQPNAEGTHARPLSTIQAGIDLAKRVGKRVYVCNGTFHEAITLADSISVIGALDCTAFEWRTGAPRTRIESPSSPAVTAVNITSATRVEGFDITSPNADQPSASSIGLLATHASGLVIATTSIASGKGMNGDDGTDGIQLANSATANGTLASTAAACVNPTTCAFAFGTGWLRPLPAAGGTNACVGAAGHAAHSGGVGGSGGVWEPLNDVSGFHFHPYKQGTYPNNGSDLGDASPTSARGAAGNDGTNAPALGTITSDAGYTPAAGTVGADGAPGLGGAGGAGRTPEPDYNPNTSAVSGVWRGFGGAGGGAGGCPGLAGSAGKGGGASIAALLIDGKVTFDNAELRSRDGGTAGRGAFGSAPTAGGLRGGNVYYSFMNGKDGGAGGAAGISGNGSSGPSIGIAYFGAAPQVLATSKVFPGTGGAAIAARSRNTLGATKTIPATPAGLSKDVLAL